ncbi:MAG: DUF1592 domain-containing protein [Sandaracinaceae bacterium]
MRRLLRSVIVSGVLLGCQGVISEPGASPVPTGACVGAACLDVEEVPVASVRFPRLTHEQWENTVADLFRLDAGPGLGDHFFPDVELGAFDTDARRLTVTAGLWADYQRAAETVAESATASGAMDAWLPADLPASGDERRDAFIREFGLRAYRRPLSDTEVSRLAGLFDEGPTHYPSEDPFTAGVRLTLEGMLQSPHFVYRAELSSEVSDDVVELNDYELASKLSYLVWDTMPDDLLFEAAAAGRLSDPDVLAEHAQRMLEDERAYAKMARFHEQLFDLGHWEDTDHNVPGWRPELAPMVVEESRLFLASIVSGGGTLRDVLTSNVAFVNEDLAGLYGIEGITGSEYQEVTLDPTVRSGLLTRVGFLTKYATLSEPDSIHRGVFINNRLLCRNIQAPPSIPDNLMPTGTTNRERITSITGPGTCGERCHGATINPVGFAFEGYDAIGQFRMEDNGQPVDAAATYRTTEGRLLRFDGAIDLSDQLADLEDPHRCYSTRLLEFAYGRAAATGDSPLLYRATIGSQNDELGVREILLELVTSRTFRTRAAEELAVTTTGDM